MSQEQISELRNDLNALELKLNSIEEKLDRILPALESVEALFKAGGKVSDVEGLKVVIVPPQEK